MKSIAAGTVFLIFILCAAVCCAKSSKEEALAGFSSAVYFDTGKYEIKSGYETTLEKLVFLLKAYPDNKVLIRGHADTSGEEKANLSLSIARAKAVGDYFADKGIDKSRIEIEGLSSGEPFGDNTSEDGKKLNRRAEVMILRVKL